MANGEWDFTDCLSNSSDLKPKDVSHREDAAVFADFCG